MSNAGKNRTRLIILTSGIWGLAISALVTWFIFSCVEHAVRMWSPRGNPFSYGAAAGVLFLFFLWRYFFEIVSLVREFEEARRNIFYLFMPLMYLFIKWK